MSTPGGIILGALITLAAESVVDMLGGEEAVRNFRGALALLLVVVLLFPSGP